MNELVDYGRNVFNDQDSILFSKYLSKIKKLSSGSFISERVKSYWNNLPGNAENSKGVDIFKFNLL